jgi:hypothetical protein
MMGGEKSPPGAFYMNNKLFIALYNSLTDKLSFDMQDKTTMRSVRILPKALGGKTAPMILCEAVTNGSGMYDGYYPLTEERYRNALPRWGILRFNQTNLFNNQQENRLKRQFTCGLDRRDGICCMYGSITLSEPPEDSREAIDRLCYFTDIFASCLGITLSPINLDWYRSERPENGG